MSVVSAAFSMCLGSIILSVVLMATAVNLAYAARAWFKPVKKLK